MQSGFLDRSRARRRFTADQSDGAAPEATFLLQLTVAGALHERRISSSDSIVQSLCELAQHDFTAHRASSTTASRWTWKTRPPRRVSALACSFARSLPLLS
jgi:hypothetical protein